MTRRRKRLRLSLAIAGKVITAAPETCRDVDWRRGCMVLCMQTNLHLNEELLREALALSGARSKKAVIEQALKVFVDSKSAENRRESYRRRVASIEEKTRRLRFPESVVELIRRDRERP